MDPFCLFKVFNKKGSITQLWPDPLEQSVYPSAAWKWIHFFFKYTNISNRCPNFIKSMFSISVLFLCFLSTCQKCSFAPPKSPFLGPSHLAGFNFLSLQDHPLWIPSHSFPKKFLAPLVCIFICISLLNKTPPQKSGGTLCFSWYNHYHLNFFFFLTWVQKQKSIE